MTIIAVLIILVSISFDDVCCGESKEKSIFGDIPGWKMSSDILTFDTENLFEYINGAADSYIDFDFQKLQVAEYSGEKQSYIMVEIYEFPTPIQSFGIYARERPLDGTFEKIGSQGYWEYSSFNFFKGRYYVKVNGSGITDGVLVSLRDFAKSVSVNLPGESSMPAILDCFPMDGKIAHSEKLIPKNFLGHSFLHSAFTSDYEKDEMTFRLFIIELDEKEKCRKMVSEFLAVNGMKMKRIDEGGYTIIDKYNGEIRLRWKGNYNWGILDFEDEGSREEYLDKVGALLEKRDL